MGGDDEVVEGKVVGPATIEVPEEPVVAHLKQDLNRCQLSLRGVSDGTLEQARGSRSFTGLWTTAIRKAVQVHGRDAVGAALKKMGRPEDSAKMY